MLLVILLLLLLSYCSSTHRSTTVPFQKCALGSMRCMKLSCVPNVFPFHALQLAMTGWPTNLPDSDALHHIS